MAKKHKHEEHVNHERWLVSFADMMTLLFALFVVLYAMGVQDIEKLNKLKNSIQFAFNISGSGKTHDPGIYEKVSGAGDTAVKAELVTIQKGGMQQFLKDELDDLKEELGVSLEILIMEDSISISAPLSDFFEEGITGRVRESVQGKLDRLVGKSLAITSRIRVVIQAADLAVYSGGSGKPPIMSSDLCYRRLRTLSRLVRHDPRVRPSMVSLQFQGQNESADRGRWEQQARVIIEFARGG